MIKTILTFVLCLPIILSAQKRTQELRSFDEIKVFDAINVTLIKSSENKAIISGKDTDKVSIVNNDGLLKVRMKIDNMLDGKETNVKIYHSETLNLVDANEKAKISSEDTIESKYLTVKAQEGAEVNLKIDTKNLNSKAVSGGEIKISGSAPNQEVIIRTGGQYNAKDLQSNRAEVTVFAGGKAFVNTKEYVDANVTAGGTVEVFGNPETIKKDKTLGGSIVMRK
ncbi:head GIN domain-containing protein [Aquimarina algicola]|nr:head GIN domain-containing protein [Aquimarina algicola]